MPRKHSSTPSGRKELRGSSQKIAAVAGKAKAKTVFQFKITLKGTKPPIWRRIQVVDCTLDKLHEHIQTAMGWTNSHLHQFEIDGEQYGDPMLLSDDFEGFDCIDSTETRISDVVPEGVKKFSFRYEYDFGDGWQHEILLEGRSQAEGGAKYPSCVAGKRACPPEDVGGVWGYADLVDAMSDPDHDRHNECAECYGSFDPDAFDPAKATQAMRRGMPNWRAW